LAEYGNLPQFAKLPSGVGVPMADWQTRYIALPIANATAATTSAVGKRA
jgi:hypothetical protein